MDSKIAELKEGIIFAAKKEDRFILGLVGSPASGKSTLAARLVEAINSDGLGRAIVLPMDGYHLSNEKLEELGLLHLKGIPQSFDAEAYLELIMRVKRDTQEIHFAPEFRREIEASVQDAIEIRPLHDIVITEGNYLLLDTEPWVNLTKYLDEVWYLSPDENLRQQRLLERHVASGRSDEEARLKISETDDPNARLIERTKSTADRVIFLD